MVAYEPNLVSTILPVFNRPEALREAVGSVLAQDYRPIEIIIVDDGSSDSTVDVADELSRAHRAEVRVTRQENLGPGAARESGRKLAGGEFLQYLDSDDVLLPRKFSRQVAALRANPDADIAYGTVRARAADGTILPGSWKRTGMNVSTLFPLILLERWWETSCPLYRRSITDAAGPWLALWQEEDWEYDCRVGSLGAQLVRVDEYVCEHRDHGGPRLCREGSQPSRMRDRACAHMAMFRHMTAAGLDRDSCEAELFARRLFLLARQCGAKGLSIESRQLFEVAIRASSNRRRRGLDFFFYRLMAMAAGWTSAGRVACWVDGLRRSA